MKNSFLFLCIGVLFSFTFFSCEKSDVTPQEEIYYSDKGALKSGTDPLVTLVELTNQLLDGVTDIEALVDLTSIEGELTEEQLEDLVQAMGFRDIDEYKALSDEIEAAYQEAEKLGYFDDKEVLEQQVEDILLNQEQEAYPEGGCSHCYTEKIRCQAAAYATSIVASFFCPLADATFFGGLVCRAIIAVGILCACRM